MIKSKLIRNSVFGTSAILMSMVSFSAVAEEPAALNKEDVIKILREEIARDPSFVLEALTNHANEQQLLAERQQNQKAIDLKSEFAKSADRPFIGNENGTVEIVYFFDVNCGYCKRLDPSLRRIVSGNKDVRISHREIPILAPSSQSAALLSNVVWQMHPDKYEKFHDELMSHQGALTDDSLEVTLSNVLGATEAMKVIEEAAKPDSEIAKKAKARVQENLELSSKAGITGTPFLYFLQTDDLMRGAGENAFEQVQGFVEKSRKAN